MSKLNKIVLACALALSPFVATMAQVKIGASLSLTGPASGVGIPEEKGLRLMQKTIAGQNIELMVLDDASDPGKSATNARRFVSQDRVDLILGSSMTPASMAIADIAAESGTVQLTLSATPPNKDKWMFRLPQSNTVMGHAIVEDMKEKKVKTVGLLGYTDSYGESFIKETLPSLEKAGIKVVGTERFARSDSNVTPQALNLVSAKPDAILIVAAGSGAAMPELGLIERGYKGLIYQTHGAAGQDLIRLGGKAVEGTMVVAGPAVVAEQLKDSHPSKKVALDFVTKYEKTHGPNSRNAFAAHSYDVQIVLTKALPMALEKAKPGTPEFRAALRDALETMGRTVLSHGVVNWTPTDHWGYSSDSPVMLKIVDGKYKVE